MSFDNVAISKNHKVPGDVGGGRPGDQYLPAGEMLVFFKIRRILKLLGSK